MEYDNYVVWFNNIYDHDWGRPQADNPPGWTRWGPADPKSLRGQSFAERVAVEKIVQRRYCVQVNNTTQNAFGQQTDIVRIYTNVQAGWDWSAPGGVKSGRFYIFDGVTAWRDGAAARWSGNTRDGDAANQIGILAGRRVLVTRQTAAVHEQMYSLLLNEDVQVTVQNPRLPAEE
jgi:hypothetical protein